MKKTFINALIVFLALGHSASGNEIDYKKMQACDLTLSEARRHKAVEINIKLDAVPATSTSPALEEFDSHQAQLKLFSALQKIERNQASTNTAAISALQKMKAELNRSYQCNSKGKPYSLDDAALIKAGRASTEDFAGLCLLTDKGIKRTPLRNLKNILEAAETLAADRSMSALPFANFSLQTAFFFAQTIKIDDQTNADYRAGVVADLWIAKITDISPETKLAVQKNCSKLAEKLDARLKAFSTTPNGRSRPGSRGTR